MRSNRYRASEEAWRTDLATATKKQEAYNEAIVKPREALLRSAKIDQLKYRRRKKGVAEKAL